MPIGILLDPCPEAPDSRAEMLADALAEGPF
jgi:hypothetical protein